MTPEQVRAEIRQAMAIPCECGDCPTDAQFEAMLTLSDEDLLSAVEQISSGLDSQMPGDTPEDDRIV